MRMTLRRLVLTVTAALGVVGLAACASSSHKSVRSYEYRDDGRPERAERADDELTDEYQMVSPGEMVVDPGR